jgi:uncharacterized protein (DUF58 family)
VSFVTTLRERWRNRSRRWRAPRTLSATRLGRTYLVLTVGIGLGALNTGNNLLYLVLGFLLSIIVLSGVLSEWAIRDVRVRRLLPEGVHAGEKFPLRYEVTRTDGRAFALKLSEGTGAIDGWAWVPYVTEGHPLVVRADATASRRGPVRLSTIEVSTYFPFGLFEKTRTLEVDDLLIVWPKRGFTCEPPAADAGRHVGDLGHSRQRDGGGDLLGLRELDPGEDARRIHWAKSASTGRLLKVEREREDRQQYTLTIDPAATLGDELDRECEETAAVTRRLLAEGHEVGLRTRGRAIRPSAGPGHERRLLTALAWVGYDDGAPTRGAP